MGPFSHDSVPLILPQASHTERCSASSLPDSWGPRSPRRRPCEYPWALGLEGRSCLPLGPWLGLASQESPRSMEPLLEACSPALRAHLSLTLEEHLDFLDRTPT